MVHDTLLPWCSYLDWEPEPSIVTVANVQHLGTRIEGRLSSPPPHVATLVRALSPTPALGGHPGPEALKLIADVEGVERDRYGGAVGWLDATGNGTWAVAIRCAQLTADGTDRPPPRRRRHRRRQRSARRARRDAGQVPGDALGAHPPVIASATARLSSAWTATLAARSVATRVTDGPRRSQSVSEVGGRVDRRGVEVVGRGDGDDVGAVRCAEQLLEAVSRQLRRLREEREDPAAVVVDDDDAQVGAATGQGSEGAGVVEEGDVADESDSRHARRGPRRGRSTSRRRCRWHHGWRGRPQSGRRTIRVAHRHRRGDDEARSVGEVLGDGTGDAGFRQRRFGVEQAGNHLLGRTRPPPANCGSTPTSPPVRRRAP